MPRRCRQVVLSTLLLALLSSQASGSSDREDGKKDSLAHVMK